MVDELLGIRVERDPLRAGDGLSLVDERADDRAQVGPLAHAAVREPGERADRVRRGVEDDLAPLRGSRIGDGRRGHPAARARVREPRDLVRVRRLRLEGAERRLALDVPLHDAGLDDLPRRKRRAADDPRDVLRDDLLVPDAVLHGRDRAAGEGVRRRCDRALGVHRLRRDDPEVARRECGRVASSPARDRSTSPAPVSRRPFALIASTCACETS